MRTWSFVIAGLIALGAVVIVARANRSVGGVDRPAPQTAMAPPTSTVSQVASLPDSVTLAPGPNGFIYRFPKPGDQDYADYQEMLRHPAYAPSGSPTPYDPEWRSFVTGRREVALHDRALSPGGAASLDDLGEEFVVAARNQAEESLAEIRITRDDFTDLLWPEFPQSRPYVHIPVDEAWFFEAAKLHEGAVSAQNMAKGRALVLEGVQTTRVLEFTNFRMHVVSILAKDEKGGESVDLTGEEGATVIECRGRFKFYLFQN